MKKLAFIAVCIVSLSALASAACISIQEAAKKIGETACVTGKVLHVGQSKGGTYFLDFCEDYRKCPFTVVVFSKDAPNVGKVKLLEGKTIEITGKIEEYQGRAEIILRDKGQLKGDEPKGAHAKVPPPPNSYDSSRHGTFSAGTFRKKK